MMNFEAAVATVRTAQLARETEDEAISVLMREALRYRKALEFYAKAGNYIDSIPMLTDPRDGLLTLPDDGLTAQRALRRLDYIGMMPALRSKEEGNTNAQA